MSIDELLALVRMPDAEARKWEINLALWHTFGEGADYVGSVDLTVALVRKVLPGWWWSCGFCDLTNDGTVCPPGSKAMAPGNVVNASVGADFRSGLGAQALLDADPCFDEGFHGDRVGGTVALALIDAMLQGLIAVRDKGPRP